MRALILLLTVNSAVALANSPHFDNDSIEQAAIQFAAQKLHNLKLPLHDWRERAIALDVFFLHEREKELIYQSRSEIPVLILIPPSIKARTARLLSQEIANDENQDLVEIRLSRIDPREALQKFRRAMKDDPVLVIHEIELLPEHPAFIQAFTRALSENLSQRTSIIMVQYRKTQTYRSSWPFSAYQAGFVADGTQIVRRLCEHLMVN